MMHQTHSGVIPYLATGSDFDLEEMLSWSAYQAGVGGNANSRQFEQCIAGGPPRQIAWVLCQLGYAAKLLPDAHPYKAVYRQILRNNAAKLWTNYLAPGMPGNNAFGIYPNVEYVVNKPVAAQKRGVALWQNQFLGSELGLLVQYGFDEFTAWRDFSLGFTVGVMQNTCWQMGSVYQWHVVDPAKYGNGADRNNPATWYTTWDACYRDTMTNISAEYATQIDVPCGSKVLDNVTGEMAGAAASNTSIPSNAQPALAMAVDAGIPGAQAAWDVFIAHNGNPHYVGGNQYNIVPRTTAA
jgi:hypothetical protein